MIIFLRQPTSALMRHILLLHIFYRGFENFYQFKFRMICIYNSNILRSIRGMLHFLISERVVKYYSAQVSVSDWIYLNILRDYRNPCSQIYTRIFLILSYYNFFSPSLCLLHFHRYVFVLYIVFRFQPVIQYSSTHTLPRRSEPRGTPTAVPLSPFPTKSPVVTE